MNSGATSAGRTRAVGTPLQRHLGLRWVPGSSPGTLSVTLDMRPDLCGPAGSLEGGVVSTLIDVTGASACAMAFGGQLVATEHITVSFVAPARVGPVSADAVVLRSGRHDAVADVRVVDRGRDDRLVAVGHVTVRRLEPRN
ncbi:MAG: PaaI family thioesterase [Acidimicrobiales bacterium]